MFKNVEPKYEKFVSHTSRAASLSGVFEIGEEIEALDSLKDKYPSFPFGFLVCFDTYDSQWDNKTYFRIDRKMNVDIRGGYYRNNTALGCTFVLKDQDFPKPVYREDIYSNSEKTPIENIEFARSEYGKQIKEQLPQALKKQVKNFPELKDLIDPFIKDVNIILEEIGWI